MANEINKNMDASSSLSNLMARDSFLNLDSNIQGKVIDAISTDNAKGKDGGFIGKIFGVKTENAAINIAFVICVICFVIVVADCVHAYFVDGATINMELIEKIIPVVTLALGYVFGQGSKK